MTEQQRLTIRAELARAMYPDAVIEPSPTGEGVNIRVYDKPNETRTWYNFDPFTNAADLNALAAELRGWHVALGAVDTLAGETVHEHHCRLGRQRITTLAETRARDGSA